MSNLLQGIFIQPGTACLFNLTSKSSISRISKVNAGDSVTALFALPPLKSVFLIRRRWRQMCKRFNSCNSVSSLDLDLCSTDV